MKSKFEAKINHLVSQVHQLKQELASCAKLRDRYGKLFPLFDFLLIFYILEKEKDMKDTLYAKLSEDHKLLMEEKDSLREKLTEQRKQCWDLEHMLAEQTDDQANLLKALETLNTGQREISDSGNKASER